LGLLGGFWIADMIGEPVSEVRAQLGKLLAIVLGVFSAGAVYEVFGSMLRPKGPT
jgi:hypothetical protein